MITKRKLKTTKTKETAVKEPKTAKMKNLKAKAKELQAKELQAKELQAKEVKATVKAVKPKVTKTKAVKKTKVVAKTKVAPKKVIGKLSEERQAFEKSINKGEFSILKTKQRGKRERNYLNELAKSLETTVKWFNRTKTALPELTSINLKFNNIKLTMK